MFVALYASCNLNRVKNDAALRVLLNYVSTSLKSKKNIFKHFLKTKVFL